MSSARYRRRQAGAEQLELGHLQLSLMRLEWT